MIALQWTFLETEHITDYLVADQVALLTASPQNPLPSILRDTCAWIQSRIPEKLHPNPMATNHIPLACKTAACHLIIEALQSRFPELQLTQDQVRNAEQARKTLEELSLYWQQQWKEKRNKSRLEAVYYRYREARHTTMKGL